MATRVSEPVYRNITTVLTEYQQVYMLVVSFKLILKYFGKLIDEKHNSVINFGEVTLDNYKQVRDAADVARKVLTATARKYFEGSPQPFRSQLHSAEKSGKYNAVVICAGNDAIKAVEIYISELLQGIQQFKLDRALALHTAAFNAVANIAQRQKEYEDSKAEEQRKAKQEEFKAAVSGANSILGQLRALTQHHAGNAEPQQIM